MYPYVSVQNFCELIIRFNYFSGEKTVLTLLTDYLFAWFSQQISTLVYSKNVTLLPLF